MKLKEKTINHLFKKGKKEVSEKILQKHVKSVQKLQKKAHNEIFKLAILNSMPIFRLIKLKAKKLEIPAYLSSYKYRASWGLKSLTSNPKNLFSSSSTIQKQACTQKKYLKHYRW